MSLSIEGDVNYESYIRHKKVAGTIRPLHGLCNAPIVGNVDSLMHYLKEAGIPYSRLHDMGGGFGGYLYVDVPNILRDENADPEDENSYDFAFTDHLLKILIDYGWNLFTDLV